MASQARKRAAAICDDGKTPSEQGAETSHIGRFLCLAFASNVLWQARLVLDAILFLWIALVVVPFPIQQRPGSADAQHSSAALVFSHGFHVEADFKSNGYGLGYERDDHDIVRFYLPALPSRYLEQFYDEFMNRPMGGSGKGHEEGWALPLGPKMSLNTTATWPSSGPVHLHLTDQLANDVWWFSQVATSPLRVQSYPQADLVFVPGIMARADPAVEGEEEYAQRFRDFIVEYMPYLPNVTDKPHVVGFPRVVWPHANDFKVMTSMQPLFFTALEPFTGRDHTMAAINEQLVVIPYQGHAHYDSMPRQHWDSETVRQSKQLLVSSSFRSRKDLRQQLRQQCEAQAAQCRHHEIDASNATDVMASWSVCTQSWYCLQPPGDTPTRRNLFDCLLAGTIPVVFDYTVIDALPFGQWIPWHDMLLVLSPNDVTAPGANVVDLIQQQHDTQRALARLELIHRHSHLLQYSLAPRHELIRYSTAWTVTRYDDAFTAAWKAIVQRLCIKGRLPHSKCCLAAAYQQHTEQPCL